MHTKLTPEHLRRIVRRTRALVVQSGLSDVALARHAPSIDPILNPQRGPWQGTAGDASGQFTIARAHVLRHAIDDDDSAAEPTLLAADTRIPVVGEAAVGGEWPHITSELSQARLWRWGHAAILRHRRDLMRGCGKQA